ncbi:MAG: DUF4864 domain-containing protein [Halofilum sp. (in: g-proteobacteria)]|nr:DUF4864 domain-containing protein [Halofilum sp. (in: g-proteobacteria)]
MRTAHWLLALLLALPAAAAAELLQPDPALSPREVVEIQLDALKHNDDPRPDFGIAQTWAFAHPDNRSQTGPLERFRRMLESPPYRLLLGHRSHAVEPMEVGDRRAVFTVTVVAASGPVVAYRWILERVDGGEHAGAWMTVAVTPPVERGLAI